jgi:uncharacterized protein (DUF1800 family)
MAQSLAAMGFPENAFEAYAPSESDPWNTPRQGHLLRRTSFGSSAQRLDELGKQSPSEAVDAILNYDVEHDPLNELIDRIDGLVSFNRIESIQDWWIYRMLYSPHPFQERLALFWHNRFATSASKVGDPTAMHNQIELFRRKGLGNYRELLIDVGRDPAMLIWLDGRANRKGKPNENYGRELMELFTLGPKDVVSGVGNYTEDDVKNMARCFTGWTIEGGKGVFNVKNFDDGQKEILGQKGIFNSASAIDVILAHPAASRFLSRKMLREFVHPNPPDEAITHYAQRLVANKWEIKPTLREIFTSRMFYSGWCYRSIIKSPIDITVGSVAALGGKPSCQFLREQSNRMGQSLLFPPNVKGWDGEEAWINANTVVLRFNFGMQLALQRQNEFARRSDFDGWLAKYSIHSADDVIDYFARVFLDGNLPPDARGKLLAFLNQDAKGQYKSFALSHETINTKVRGLVHMMVSTPEYQLA